MATEPQSVFVLPDLGEGLQEAEIVAWHVGRGRSCGGGSAARFSGDGQGCGRDPIAAVRPHRETARRSADAPGNRRAARRVRRQMAGVTQEPSSANWRAQHRVQPAARPRATPAVRALAASRGVDLAAIAGSGPEGEITRADVERASAAQTGVGASQRHSQGDGASHGGGGSGCRCRPH